MIRLCATVALACVAAASGAATAAPANAALSAKAKARAAVAPLAVESVVCVRQAPRKAVCQLAHPDVDGRECRSVVVVRPNRVRIVQSNVCFVFREVTP